MNWQPIPHTIIRDKDIQQEIHEIGYKVVDFLTEEQLNKLSALYKQTHQFEGEKGGMFYSVYSQDLDYRKKVHEGIGAIINDSLATFFKDYKTIINSFIVKANGPESEFYLHQDTTGTDEYKYSPLSIWAPLHDVDLNNGALCVVPKTHHLFSPYRSISFPTPFDHIQGTVKKYLVPIPLKAGQALIFDNRVVHNSVANNSDRPRVAITAGLFPKEAPFITCFKENKDDKQIELIAHEDKFLLEGKNFLVDCFDRPKTGNSMGFVADEFAPMSSETFMAHCQQLAILPTNLPYFKQQTNCQMIGEPVFDTGDLVVEEASITASPTNKEVHKAGIMDKIIGLFRSTKN